MADVPATPAIQSVKQSTTVDQNGKTITTYSVQFMVGTDGPFTIYVPAADFTAAEVQKRMQAIAVELAQLPRAGA